MEFHEKLQLLRKQKSITQEELAKALYVSRTAISKWESGRGYPSIESLKAIAIYFSVTVDELLSCDEVVNLAQDEQKQRKARWCDFIFGMLNVSVSLFYVLPWFGQTVGGALQEVSLLALTAVTPYMRCLYLGVVSSIVLFGVLMLALQNCHCPFWVNHKHKLSLMLHVVGLLLFVLGSQPYAAALLFVFLMIQAMLLLKR